MSEPAGATPATTTTTPANTGLDVVAKSEVNRAAEREANALKALEAKSAKVESKTEAANSIAEATSAKDGVPPAAGATGQEKSRDEKKNASRYADVLRREAALVEKKKAFAAEKEAAAAAAAALAKTRAEVEAEKERIAKMRAQAKADPLGWMQFGEVSYEDASRAYLNGGKPSAEERAAHEARTLADSAKSVAEQAKQELANFVAQQKRQMEAKAAEEQKRLDQENLQTIAGFKQDLTEFCEANADEYPRIAIRGAADTVFAVIAEHAKRTKTVLSHKDAAEKVEKFFAEQDLKTQERLRALEAKKAKPPATDGKGSIEAGSRSTSEPRTLSAGLQSETPKETPKPKAASWAEREKRALAVLTERWGS